MTPSPAVVLRHTGSSLVASVLCVLPSGPAQAQSPSSLGAPSAVFAEPFSQIRGVRELSDGSLLLTDWIEQRLVRIDPTLRQLTRVGRSGPVPQEYRLPGALLPMAGDSTLMSDVGNARLAVLAPDGTIARIIPANQPGLSGIAGVDHQGRLYFAMPAWARQASRLPEDSLEVLRYDPGTGQATAVAVVKGVTPPRNRGPRLTPGFPMIAFAPQDAWRVLPTGELLVVRAGDYHVERLGGAATRSGPSYREATDRVRDADKTWFVREFTSRAPTSGRGPDGSMGRGPELSAAEVAQMVATNEFAETLPPFERVQLAPDGELWVQRGRHAGDPAVYDRFDVNGQRLGQVRLPAGRTVVGLGRQAVYVAAADADGLETLERYRRP